MHFRSYELLQQSLLYLLRSVFKLFKLSRFKLQPFSLNMITIWKKFYAPDMKISLKLMLAGKKPLTFCILCCSKFECPKVVIRSEMWGESKCFAEKHKWWFYSAPGFTAKLLTSPLPTWEKWNLLVLPKSLRGWPDMKISLKLM